MPSLRPIAEPLLERGARALRAILPAQVQFFSDVGKVARAKIADWQATRAVAEGVLRNRLTKFGLMDTAGKWLIEENKFPELMKAMNYGEHYASPELKPKVAALRKFFYEVYKEFRSVGSVVRGDMFMVSPKNSIYKTTVEEPIGYIHDYFPRYLKQDYARAFLLDSDKVFEAAAKTTNDWTIFKDWKRSYSEADVTLFNALVDQGMGKNLFDPKTHQNLQLLISRGMSPGQALIELRNRAMNQIRSPFMTFKHKRMLNLADESYEDHPLRALDTYVRNAAKHIANLKTWGVHWEKFDELNAQLSLISPVEAKYLNLMNDILQGTAEYHLISEGFNRFTRALSSWEVGTKIGLGKSFLPNITQLFISTIPKVGIYRFVRSIGSAFTQEGKELAKKVGFYGRINYAMNIMAGMPDEFYKNSALSRIIHDHPGMKFFNWVNKWNNIITAVNGEVYLKDMARRAARGSKWGASQLERYGIDPSKSLTEEDLLKGIHRFVTDLQLQKDVLKDPLWMNDPRFRFLGLFKRFGIRQALNVWENVAQDLLLYGNAMPLLRFASLAPAGGYFVIWAKDMINTAWGNDPALWRNEDKGMFQQLLYWYSALGSSEFLKEVLRGDHNEALHNLVKDTPFALSQAGGFGWASDVLGRIRDDEFANDLMNNLYFQVNPVIMAEIYGQPGNYNYKGWAQLLKEFAEEMGKDGFHPNWKRIEADVLIKLSPLTSDIGYTLRKQIRQKKIIAKKMKAFYREIE